MKTKLLVLLVLAIIFLPALSQASSHINPLNVDTTSNAKQYCILPNVCFTAGYNPPDQFITTGGTTGGGVTTPPPGDLSTLQGIMASLAYFLGAVLLPFMFGIALLIFLVNATRYFIIGGDDEESRKKAKRLAIYSVAAFVFLVSLWGIVNMFVVGLQINQTQSICPDYLGNTCLDKSYNRSLSTFFNTGGTSGGGATGGNTGSNSNTGGTYVGPALNNLNSALGELVFGSYLDTPTLNFTSGAPRSTNLVPNISSTATCSSGISTLQTASAVETNETAYLLYADSNGITKWTNVTDLTYQNGVAYDADTISNILSSGAANVYLIHTHTKDNLTTAGLKANGYGPSVADMKLMCDTLLPGVTHVVVDWNNVWVLDQSNTACPRTQQEESNLPVIESILLLSQVTAGDRAQEFTDYINDNNLPSSLKTALQPLLSNSFDTMTVQEIVNLSTTYQNQANINITQTDPTGFCFSLSG